MTVKVPRKASAQFFIYVFIPSSAESCLTITSEVNVFTYQKLSCKYDSWL